MEGYNIRAIYRGLRLQHQHWTKVAWAKWNIPKASFTTWLPIQIKLKTRDRLKKWNIVQEAGCVFCANQESHNHLFFACPYSAGLLRKVNEVLKIWIPGTNSWHWLANKCKCSMTKKKLIYLMVSTLCYTIWKERDCRSFTGKQQNEGQIWKKVLHYTRNQIMYKPKGIGTESALATVNSWA